jgi:hypothetical protein
MQEGFDAVQAERPARMFEHEGLVWSEVFKDRIKVGELEKCGGFGVRDSEARSLGELHGG